MAASGLQSIGGVLVPLNTRFKGAEAGEILRRRKARLLLTVGEFLGVRYPRLLAGEPLPHLERIVLLRGSGVTDECETWPAFLSCGDSVTTQLLESRCAQVRESDTLDLMFTSGTTGKPKAAVSTHGKTMQTFWMFTEWTTLESSDRYLIINPFFHTFGYKYGWLACVMRGACMVPIGFPGRFSHGVDSE
jgi:acyl-CoA synthetase (AMP-forming)/AMP-acid ligase II